MLEWEEKEQLTSSLIGSHGLPLPGLKLDWRAFYNENRAKDTTGPAPHSVRSG